MGLFAKLRARLVKPDKPAVIAPLPLSQQIQRIGGAITPSDVSSIIQEADTGACYRLIDLANEARQKDCHLQAILGTREIALAGLGFSVKPAVLPGEKKPSTQSEEISSFVRASLLGAEGRGKESKSLYDMIAHISGAVYYGFAVTEIDWKRDGKYIVPGGFYLVSPRRFEFSRDGGELRWYDQSTMTTGVSLPDKYPQRFIQHQPRINGDIPAREGLSRVLMWAAMFRNWDIFDWMRLAELAWRPWRIGTYKQGASTKDISDLQTALQYLTTAGVATHSERTDIHIEWPERGRGARPGHAILAEFLSMEMSKAVLGQTLTTEQGERGARSLGEVHDRVRRDVRESDAFQSAATIRRDLIAPLVRLNYGMDALIPEFAFVTEDAPELGGFARGIGGLVTAGLRIPQKWVRDKAGIPEPEGDEEILVGASSHDVEVDLSDLEEEDDPNGEPPEEEEDEEGTEDDDE